MSNADLDYIENELRATRSKSSPWPPLSGHILNAYTRLESLRTVTPPPPAPGPSVLFEDTFDGFAGVLPETKKWCAIGGQNLNGCPRTTDNVFLDGDGYLVLRTKRVGTGYSGALVGTFNYGAGPWPPSVVKASWTPPFRIEAKVLMPPTPGAHPSMWLINVDRPDTQNIYEIDFAEERMTFPTVAGSHIHTWRNRAEPIPPEDAQLTVTDMGKNWHTYAAEVYPNRVSTYIDDKLIGTFSRPLSGRFGLLLDSGIDPVDKWGSGGKQPDPSDPGPWDMKAEGITVAQL